jgi:peptidoglycan/xylan/chitin deacetylase (PgdA/CDA1 family)
LTELLQNAHMGIRQTAIGLGLATLAAARAHWLAPAAWRGHGAILMFHHVRPFRDRGFSPNRELEVTPEFLDGVLGLLAERGYRFAALDDLPALLSAPPGAPPFAILTFDDGYRDFEEWALPILRRRQSPATLFVTTGFADRSAAPWWIVAEEALARLRSVDVAIDGVALRGATDTPQGKERLGARLLPLLRAASEAGRIAAVAALAAAAAITPSAIAAELCLDWDDLAALDDGRLITLGAHTLTHPMLARLSADAASREIGESAAIMAARLGRPVRHFAYPVGTPEAAGERDFALVAAAGFATAVTTRPGMIFSGSLAHPHALPRLSINGRFQRLSAVDVLLSGLPFALLNLAGRLR